MNLRCRIGLHDWEVVARVSLIDPMPLEICRRCSVGRRFNIAGACVRYSATDMVYMAAVASAKRAHEQVAVMPFTFATFAAMNHDRCQSAVGFNHQIDSWSLSEWMVATFGELGEAGNVVKKLNRIRDGVPGNKQSEAELREQLELEIGDTAIYLDLTAQRAGFTLEQAIIKAFNRKSAEIGYPARLPETSTTT